MNSPVDAIAEVISYLNQHDFAAYHAACGPTHPLHPRHDRVNAHYLHFTLDSHFQPIVALVDERVVAHEAFLRIPVPAGIAPIGAAFEPETLFSHCSDDNEITYLDRLTRTLHALNFLLQNAAAPDQAGILHLNVHPQHLLAVGNDHGETFERILQQCGLAPASIVLEVTEHRITEKNRLANAIKAWQSRGYRIAIDNFGRDQAPDQDTQALALRPDLIKIDRTVLHRCAGNPQRAQKLAGDIERARDRGVDTIVVGVENLSHATIAREIGASHAQGHYFGKALPHCLSADFDDVRWEN